jgi:electron transport complex protein RnfD
MAGSIGEVSALALLLGAAYLFYKRILTWHIPTAFIGTVILLSGLFWLINPEKYPDPVFHLLTGGLILGAFFMATDMVTSPVSIKGMLLFGAGCGLLTVLIRLFGGYPEGVSFAILLMNAATPLIDRYTRPKTFGTLNQEGAQ